MQVRLAAMVVWAVLQVGLGGAPAMAQVVSDTQPGLSGRVTLASRCPVPVGADEGTCPTVPFATELAVRSADGSAEVARVASDADGQFSVALDPGQYLIEVPAPGGGAASGQVLPVTVLTDGPTTVSIQVRPLARTIP